MADVNIWSMVSKVVLLQNKAKQFLLSLNLIGTNLPVLMASYSLQKCL